MIRGSFSGQSHHTEAMPTTRASLLRKTDFTFLQQKSGFLFPCTCQQKWSVLCAMWKETGKTVCAFVFVCESDLSHTPLCFCMHVARHVRNLSNHEPCCKRDLTKMGLFCQKTMQKLNSLCKRDSIKVATIASLYFNTSTESEDILCLVRFLSLAFARFLALSCCCYQVPFSHHVGELRAHYAGFFDPGFGFGTNGDIKGSIGVLEVLSVQVCV